MKRRIAHVTDIHLDEEFVKGLGVDARKNWSNILEDISSKGIEEIIFGGDIGEIASNKWFFESLRNYNISLTLGNHDYFEVVVKHFDFRDYGERKELYYSELSNNYTFIFLDSSSGLISQEQFEWFKNELISPKRILLFIHHPILEVNAEVDNQFALEGRDKLKDVLLNIENDVTIFCGHYHFEDESSSNNIRQFITPASSYQIEKIPNEIITNNNTFGYRIIELNDEEIHTSLVMFSNLS